MKNLTTAAILIFAFWLLRKFQAAKGLIFQVIGIRTEGDLLSASIILQTEVNNPTSQPINIDSIQANVLISGKKIGEIDFNTRSLLIPGKNFIDIPVKLNPLMTAGLIFDLLKEKKSFKVITLEGEITFEGITTPYDTQFNLLDNA